MKKIFLLLVVFSSLIFSQFNRNNPSFNKRASFLFNRIFYSELYTINQKSNNAFFLYKIPYARLLFEKSNGIYKAKFRVSLEIFDYKNNSIQREFDEKTVRVKSYEITKSIKDYVEGVIQITFFKKAKKILPTFSDVFSEREFKGKLIEINNFKNNTIFLTPIVVKKRIYHCKDLDNYELANFGGDFPFSENKYKILLPINDLETDELFVRIKSRGKTIINKSINNSFNGKLDFKDCEGKIILNIEDTDNAYQFFILDNFDKKLVEDPIKIQVSTSSDFSNSHTFSKRIRWFNKPLSLRNTEQAIKYLKYIEKKSVINNMLDHDSFQYAKLLHKYWKKFDPTPNTAYNPIMKEYYERIDYAMKNFMPISRKNGANTDRGKIYIKYGKPNKIERTSNTYGQVTVIWIYNKVRKRFVFIDKYGIGDFSLAAG